MAPHSRYAPSTHVAVVQKYPMYVLPLKKVLALEKIQSHEELWQELVQVTEPEQMTIIFCSHTWLRSAHPDDAENSKLALLQAVLRRAIDGKLQINAHWLTEINGLGNNRITAVELQRDLAGAFCWFDYWSVPQSLSAQHEQALAIESIVSYVSQCRYFFVLAGAWRHENGSLRDVRAWQARGWCKWSSSPRCSPAPIGRLCVSRPRPRISRAFYPKRRGPRRQLACRTSQWRLTCRNWGPSSRRCSKVAWSAHAPPAMCCGCVACVRCAAGY